MPTFRLETHRLAKGWITAAALDAGSYLITGLTVVSDQRIGGLLEVEWLAPTAPSTTPTRPVAQRALSGIVRKQGFLTVQLTFDYWTFGMEKTFESTFYTDPDVSEAVTLKTFNKYNEAKYLQCYLDPLDLPGANGEPAPGGWKNVKVVFSGGTFV